MLTKEGVYVRTYGGPLAGPSQIAIDDEGNALVSNMFRSILYHHGNMIHEVRDLNSDGIALDPGDGSVYVADCNANAVLKYSVI